MNPYLIIGSGAIARLTLPLLPNPGPVFVLCRRSDAMADWRTRGAIPILGDLDHPNTLSRLGGLAHTVLHFAPPNGDGPEDRHTKHLICTLRQAKILPQRLIYISTTGVYGTRKDIWTVETSAINPTTARAIRRADAESRLRRFGQETGCRITILRVPGIYDSHRLPLERLKRNDPLPLENPWTNHIHSLDLARAVIATLHRGKPQRIYHAVDDEPLPVNEFYSLLAQHFGLPIPNKLPYEQLADHLSPISLSFLRESRRLGNQRTKQELQLRWRYPSIREFLNGSEFL